MSSLQEIKNSWTVGDVFEALAALDYYDAVYQEQMEAEERKSKTRGRR